MLGLNPVDSSARVAVDNIAANTSTNASVTVGGTFTGNISAPNTGGLNGASADVDWIAVTLTAGHTYSIATAANGASPVVDTVLSIYNTAGTTVLATDDDGGPNLYSLVTFSPTTTGTYYIAVRGYDTAIDSIGGYSLSVAEAPPQDPLNTIDWGTAVTPTVGVIYVYFAQNGEVFDGETSTGWTAAEINAAMLAFQQFANVANVTFQQTTNSAQAQFHLVQNSNGTDLGYFNPPGTTNAGVGWFNDAGTGWDAAGLAQGGYGFITLIHEFGHGMGLAHPHDNGGTSEVMQGVTGAFGSFGTFQLNQGVFTMMSYNDGWQTAPHGTSPSNSYGWEGTLMALDIAVIQQKYGVNTTYHAGNDTYLLPDANAAGTYYSCIWDAGGVDRINYTGTRNATIDLRPATLLSEVGGGGYVSYAATIHGGYTIANGVVIEHASGGSGNDTITGNDSRNSLAGNTGYDTITGGAGGDWLYGGNNVDNLNGGIGNDAIYGGLGNDRLWGGQGQDSFFFNSALNGTTNVDNIYDFSHAADTIRLDATFFAGLPVGNLAAAAFYGAAGATAAHDATDRIIYNSTTGDLYFDRDGTGVTYSAIRFATLTTHPTNIDNTDFVIIA